MSNIQDLYDDDVIASVVGAKKREYEAKQEDPSQDPLNNIKTRELTISETENQQTFESLFWTPTTIPGDLPVTQFERTDWPEEAQVMIPDIDPNWVWNKEVTESFALAMYCGDTTLLYGLQGTGKSCTAEQWCAFLNIPFWRMNCNRETRETHFLGSAGIEYNEEGQMVIKQEPTMLTDSLRYGGMFLEDEAFRHNAALVLQSLREKSNRTLILPDAPGRTAEERVLKAPVGRWWYVLTDNTTGSGDETGMFDAEVQDASTLDRIDVAIEVPYLDRKQESVILGNHSNLDQAVLDGMTSFAKLVRAEFSKGHIMATMSVRPLLAWADKAELTGNVERGLQLSWFNKLCKDDQEVIKDKYHQMFRRSIV